MSITDLGNDVTGTLEDLDREMENEPEAETLGLSVEMYEAPPLVEEGHPGEAELSETLGGTGLELSARRVLSMRGIEVADLRQPNPARPPLDGGQLRDIVEASSDAAPVTIPTRSRLAAEVLSVVPESVIGPDDRVRVFDTHLYPFSAIAALEITAKDGSMYVGTGWFVGKHTLITAGHCVFVRDPKRPTANGWVRSIRVIPGRNGRGPGSEPFGSVTATRFRSVSGWVEKGNADSDYGAIFLDPGSTPNGAQVGQFGMKVYGDAALQALNLNVAGYPADKKGNEAQTLWFDVKRTAQVRPRQVFYDADTFGGQSGAPVFEVDGDARRVVAIHAYGVSMGEKSNSGTRITPDVFKRIQEWKDS